MPTFKNNTERWKDVILRVDGGELLIRFAPGEEKELTFWVPYQEKGLTLVDADNPKVPETILVSGTFDFDAGMERRFSVPPCDKYIVNVIVQTGSVKLYPGNANAGAELVQATDTPFRYKAVYQWDYAPYLRVAGVEAGTRATIHAEVERKDKEDRI